MLSSPAYKVVEPVGSPGYAAPELLRVLPYDGQVDVFSLGVVSFVLLSGACCEFNPLRSIHCGSECAFQERFWCCKKGTAFTSLGPQPLSTVKTTSERLD